MDRCKVPMLSHNHVAAVLAEMLEGRVKRDARRLAMLRQTGQMGTMVYEDVFCGPNDASISVRDYIERIIFYITGMVQYEIQSGRDAMVQPDLALRYLVVALMLIEKLYKIPQFYLCSRNIHRLLITGVTVAAKVLDDRQPNNSFFAMLGGLTLKELNHFEAVFCMTLQFNLTIPPEEFDAYYNSILKSMQQVPSMMSPNEKFDVSSDETISRCPQAVA